VKISSRRILQMMRMKS